MEVGATATTRAPEEDDPEEDDSSQPVPDDLAKMAAGLTAKLADKLDTGTLLPFPHNSHTLTVSTVHPTR
jgi:hypothetical protein